MTEQDGDLADFVGRFYADPLGFVLAAYDWDNDSNLQVCRLGAPWNLIYDSQFGPDEWACDLLAEVGDFVRANAFDPLEASPVSPILEAVSSGHGIGKSAMTAWLVNWIMSTRPHAKGVVTANTAEQLASKTWAEIAKWTKRSITGHWFEVTTGKGAMRMYHKQHPESWRCDAQTCREENSESFAGLHAVNSTPFYIFDEASAVPNKIFEVAQGGLTDGEPMMFAFGNPTRNSGWFHAAFHGQAHRWRTRSIDSRTVQITNKKLLGEWVKDYGEDSDFVKIRVRGMFPSQSARQFISTADIDAAAKRHLRPEQYDFAPVILSLDNAWTGEDEVVIGKRQGLKFDVLYTSPRNDNDGEVASRLMQLEDEHKADAVFIDAGYGTGVYSFGKMNGRNWQLVWFSGKSLDNGYLNKRAEMIGEAKQWLKDGGAISPQDKVLQRDLAAPETVPRADGVIQIESKEDMKRRGQASPNRLDALALTFAEPVQKRDIKREVFEHMGVSVSRTEREYDPFANI